MKDLRERAGQLSMRLLQRDGLAEDKIESAFIQIRNEALEEAAKVPAAIFSRMISKVTSPYQWGAEACGFAAELEQKIVALKDAKTLAANANSEGVENG